MRSFFASLLAIIGFGHAAADTPALESGQVWTFKDAPAPETRIIIGDIDQLWEGKLTAVSIAIVNLPSVMFPNGVVGGDEIFHMPFKAEELQKHLVGLDDAALVIPEGYGEGYQIWRDAVEAGEAGVFTISPSEAIEIVRDAILGAQ